MKILYWLCRKLKKIYYKINRPKHDTIIACGDYWEAYEEALKSLNKKGNEAGTDC